MKRQAFIALAAMLLVFSACMRDEDMALLKKPIRLQGSMDPTIGVPAAHGRMTLHDILGMLSSSYTGHIYDTTDIITIYFDTTLADTVRNVTPGLSGTKTNVIGKDTTLRYYVNISLFDGAEFDQMLANDNITIGDLWLDLYALFKAHAPSNVAEVVNNENYVSSSVDNIKIYYTKHDGTEVPFTGLSLGSTTLKHLMQGDTVERIDINMKSIINDLPKRIRVDFDYHFWLTDQFILSYPIANYETLYDSLDKVMISYDVNLDAEFPFDVKINRLPYSFTINLNGDSLPRLDIQQTLDSIARGLSVNLNDAKLTLSFNNGIPAKFNISTYLIDANNNIIGDTLIHDTVIAAAPVAMDATGHYVASGTRATVIPVPINEQRLRDLKQTRKLGFNLTLATDNGANNVSIRRNDYLDINAFITVHPQANINIPITNQGLIK